jgi:acetyltransferase EpsM
MQEKIIIIGAGSQARIILYVLSKIGDSEVIGFIDTFNNPDIWGKEINGKPVLGNIDSLDKYPPSEGLKVIPAIHNTIQKRNIVSDLIKKGYSFKTLIHPDAKIADSAKIGEGSIIMEDNHIDIDVTIGRFVVLHRGSMVHHDTVLGDFVFVSPGSNIGGRVTIGEGTIIYLSTTIISNVSIGENSIIGAGTVVIKDVKPNVKVVGVPAKIIGELD